MPMQVPSLNIKQEIEEATTSVKNLHVQEKKVTGRNPSTPIRYNDFSLAG